MPRLDDVRQQLDALTISTNPFYGHALKKTNRKEYNIYSAMRIEEPLLLEIIPHCCFIVKDGEITKIEASLCKLCFCRMQISMYKLKEAATNGYFIVSLDPQELMTAPKTVTIKLWEDEVSDLSFRRQLPPQCQADNLHQLTHSDNVEGITYHNSILFQQISGLFSMNPDQIELITTELIRIKKKMEQLKGWRFYGSSIRIVADTEAQHMVSVDLIDLGNADYSEEFVGPDIMSISGVHNIVKLLGTMSGENDGKQVQFKKRLCSTRLFSE